MEQHPEVGKVIHDIEIYSFADETRSDEAKKGDEIQLNLVSAAKRMNLTVTVNWREDYPNGYELVCSSKSLARRATVIVSKDRPDMDGVRLQMLLPTVQYHV